MKDKYPNLEVKEYETWNNRENQLLFQQMATAYGIKPQGVPSTFLGDNQPIVGFNEDMEEGMEEQIKVCLKNGCIDPSSKLQ
jgi:hypothetical protein